MARVYVFCEGRTEELFVNRILRPYFDPQQIWLTPILIGGRAGGVNTYGKIRKQITIKCKEDAQSVVTTLLDYYAFPQDRDHLLPVRNEVDPIHRALAFTAAFQADIGYPNFIANVVIHEFEGLLFSQPAAFKEWFDNATVGRLWEIKKSVKTPEHINDDKATAPSKRLKMLCKGYDKTRHGPLIAQAIGLDVIRKECPNFQNWLNKIESLGAAP